MTEHQQPPETQNTPGSSPPPDSRQDWRAQRRAEREARREDRLERWGRHSGRSGLVWGGILILLGVVFFLQNAGVPVTFNWWAIFILIPAFWSILGAWDSFRGEGRITRRGAGSLVGGTLLTVLALVLLFDIGLTTLWPILLVIAGIALILTGFVPA